MKDRLGDLPPVFAKADCVDDLASALAVPAIRVIVGRESLGKFVFVDVFKLDQYLSEAVDVSTWSWHVAFHTGATTAIIHGGGVIHD